MALLFALLAFGALPSPGSAQGAGGERNAWADALRPHSTAWAALASAEDARARAPEQLETLIIGVESDVALLRQIAVRALGRLERRELTAAIAPLLKDPDPGVRAAAAKALAQAVQRQDPGMVRPWLTQALADERDPSVRGALAEALGRTLHDDANEAAATLGLLTLLLEEGMAARTGALRGIYFLARQRPAQAAFGPAVHSSIRALLKEGGEGGSAASGPSSSGIETGEEVRALALATLLASGIADRVDLDRASRDDSPWVRREAALGIGSLPEGDGRLLIARRLLEDPSGHVRHDALRSYGLAFAATDGCEPVRTALDDPDLHVALHAISLLGNRCLPSPADLARLDEFVRALSAVDEGGWHRSAHALLALAEAAPERAGEALVSFTSHPSFFVRMYGVRAARLLGDRAILHAMAGDAHPNVRTAAVQGLTALAGHEADDVYLAQLDQDDSQLLMATAAALQGTLRANAARSLLDALDRVTEARRETSRDARRALLVRVGEVGGATHAPRVAAYLADFDPEIASLAADIVAEWTGVRPEPAPSAPPALSFPSFEELAVLEKATLVIEIEGEGVIELRLHPFVAPANVARFARLARSGYYDGLTLHRVVPNFVIQGGSPHANEYLGDGPFTRDEVGLRNSRGSVGLSTRGRDTGDAQLYINTVNNVRLDHDYTVWAEVLEGMDIVDRLQEGAIMQRVRLRLPE